MIKTRTTQAKLNGLPRWRRLSILKIDIHKLTVKVFRPTQALSQTHMFDCECTRTLCKSISFVHMFENVATNIENQSITTLWESMTTRMVKKTMESIAIVENREDRSRSRSSSRFRPVASPGTMGIPMGPILAMKLNPLSNDRGTWRSNTRSGPKIKTKT